MPKSKSRKKKPPKRVWPSGSRTRQDSGAEQHDLRQRPADVRARDSRVRDLALFGAAPRVQSHRRSPIQTTERYLGCKQKLRCAVNDRLGIEPDAAARLASSANPSRLRRSKA